MHIPVSRRSEVAQDKRAMETQGPIVFIQLKKSTSNLKQTLPHIKKSSANCAGKILLLATPPRGIFNYVQLFAKSGWNGLPGLHVTFNADPDMQMWIRIRLYCRIDIYLSLPYRSA